MLKKFTLSVAAAAATITVMPAAAQAQGYYRDGYYENARSDRYYRGDRVYRGDRYQGRNYRSTRNQYRRCSGTTGTIVGGAAGALLGREIAGRGDRTTGTILGGAVGALLGREVGKSSCRR